MSLPIHSGEFVLNIRILELFKGLEKLFVRSWLKHMHDDLVKINIG